MAVPQSLALAPATSLCSRSARERSCRIGTPKSDTALVSLDSSIDVVIGPFEPDEDGWLGLKTAFECFLSLRDEQATKQVAAMAAQLPILQSRSRSTRLCMAPSQPNPGRSWC